jgi:hypothetical protein
MTPATTTEGAVVERAQTPLGVTFVRRVRNRERVEPTVDERRYISLSSYAPNHEMLMSFFASF